MVTLRWALRVEQRGGEKPLVLMELHEDLYINIHVLAHLLSYVYDFSPFKIRVTKNVKVTSLLLKRGSLIFSLIRSFFLSLIWSWMQDIVDLVLIFTQVGDLESSLDSTKSLVA